MLEQDKHGVTPYKMGQDAYAAGIKAPCHDRRMLEYLANHTSGQVGSGIEPLKQWQKGYHETMRIDIDRQMKNDFPELYGNQK